MKRALATGAAILALTFGLTACDNTDCAHAAIEMKGGGGGGHGSGGHAGSAGEGGGHATSEGDSGGHTSTGSSGGSWFPIFGHGNSSQCKATTP